MELKATGITRPVDALGRIVVPKELRRKLGIREGDPMEIFTTPKGIFIQKYHPADTVAGFLDSVKEIIHQDMNLSPKAKERLLEMAYSFKAAVTNAEDREAGGGG